MKGGAVRRGAVAVDTTATAAGAAATGAAGAAGAVAGAVASSAVLSPTGRCRCNTK